MSNRFGMLLSTACLLSMALSSGVLRAQDRDSLFVLGEITIEANADDDDSGRGLLTVDLQRMRSRAATDVSRLLDHVPGLDVLRHGNSGAALASFRGLGAASTRVRLDGIRLMDPATGSFDLSLLPAALVHTIKAQSGTAAGSIPGGVLAFSTPEYAPREVALEAGAFSRFGLHAQSAYDHGRTSVMGALTASTLEGDFPYAHPVRLGNPVVRRQGAGRSNTSLFFSGRHDVSRVAEPGVPTAPPSVRLRFMALASRVDRSIPSLSNADAPAARQEDELVLTGVSATTVLAGMPVQTMLSSTWSGFRYRTDDGNATRVDIGEVAFNTRIGRLVAPRWFVSLDTDLQRSRVSTSRHHTISETGARITLDHVRSSLSAGVFLDARYRRTLSGENTHRAPTVPARTEQDHVWAPGIWAAYRQENGLELRTALSRVVRLPTLNERFWEPGGNALLTAEHGVQAEAGLSYGRDDRGLHAGITVFVSRISDRIVWRPALAGNALHVWTPDNVARVQGRGAEGRLNWTAFRRLTIMLSGTRLIQEDHSHPSAASYGHQLRFVPPWTMALDVEYRRDRIGLYASWRGTGRRYTATDESIWMPPQQVMDAGVLLSWPEGPLPVSLTVSGFNLADRALASSPWMPLPGREWRVLLRFNP